MDIDTDTLLALVSSLLTEPVPHTDVVLNALVQANGDAKTAVQLLNHRPKAKKRKVANLDDWLATNTPSGSSEHKLITASPLRKPKSSAPVNLMSVLRDPPSRSEKIVPQLRPLMLSNPIMVAENTPCTLHLSVLPQELACRLFYTMVHAARDWQRNKWWLFDKVVESPHRTSFFTRKDDGKDESWQDAAQFWCFLKPFPLFVSHAVVGITAGRLILLQHSLLLWKKLAILSNES
jgi:hypothetical protein